MSKHLLVINGHPDPRPERFCSALGEAFVEGARGGDWSVHTLDAATLNFSTGEGRTPISLETAAGLIQATDRLAIVFPLWFDAPPAPVIEVFRLAARQSAQRDGLLPEHRTRNREARLIITMEMPAFMHRSMMRADGRRKDGKEIETLPGFDAAHITFVGSVGAISPQRRRKWLRDIRDLGAMDVSASKGPRRFRQVDMDSVTARAA